MYEEDYEVYEATTTKKAMISRLLQDEFETVFVNNSDYSIFSAINYLEYLGETKWKIKDNGLVCKAVNYQPALSEVTVIELWR